MSKKIRLGAILVSVLAIVATTAISLATSDVQGKFEVYVPDKLELHISEDGTSEIIGNQKIFNASSDTVKVKEYNITGLNGWSVVDYNTDFSQYADNTKTIGVQVESVENTWNIGTGEWLNLNIEAKVPNFTEKVDLTDVVKIEYDIGWATSSDGEDGLDPNIDYIDFTITVENRYMTGFGETNEFVIPKTFEYGGKHYKVVGIANQAFTASGPLKSIVIPNTVTTFGIGIFNKCYDLESVELPNNMTVIPDHIFGGCRSLKSITIPNSVTAIGYEAFNGCESLTSVTIPGNVKSIGYNAFANCNKLESVLIMNGVQQIGEGAFCYLKSLKSVTIPNSVTSIDRDAFYGCSALDSVTIPNSVVYIGYDAFRDVPHIEYNGTATGQPWGARAIN